MTPAKTRSGLSPTSESGVTTRPSRSGSVPRVAATSRTTPKGAKADKESPPWWPWMLLGLIVAGGAVIMVRYLAYPDTGWLTVIGLVCILAALYLATLWR